MSYKRDLINNKKEQEKINKLEQKIEEQAKKVCLKLAHMSEDERREYFEKISYKAQLLEAELKDLKLKKEKLDSDYVDDFGEDTQDRIFVTSILVSSMLIGGLMFMELGGVTDVSLSDKFLGGFAMTGLSALGGTIIGFLATMGISLRPISNLSLKLKKLATNSRIKIISKQSEKANTKFENVKKRYTPNETEIEKV